jgi:hypothetical protein
LLRLLALHGASDAGSSGCAASIASRFLRPIGDCVIRRASSQLWQQNNADALWYALSNILNGLALM